MYVVDLWPMYPTRPSWCVAITYNGRLSRRVKLSQSGFTNKGRVLARGDVRRLVEQAREDWGDQAPT